MPDIYQTAAGEVVAVHEHHEGRTTVERPATGDRSTVSVGSLREPTAPPFVALGTTCPDRIASPFSIESSRTRGVLVYVARWGPVTVESLLRVGECCERELNASLSELQIAGCLEPAQTPGADFAVTEAVASRLRS